MSTEVDHLVVAAATLDDGVRWCEATLGLTPGPGGRHATMATHNRLLNLSSPAFPRCYLEIIAVDPDAPPVPRVRWFGLDDAALQTSLRSGGPRLIHAVVRTQEMETHHWGLVNKGLNPGQVLRAHRDTAQGRLEWQIAVRDDGRLLCGGVLPTLIQWDGPHPTDAMPASGAQLLALRLGGLPAAAHDLLRIQGVAGNAGAPQRLTAIVGTPGGEVVLAS